MAVAGLLLIMGSLAFALAFVVRGVRLERNRQSPGPEHVPHITRGMQWMVAGAVLSSVAGFGCLAVYVVGVFSG